VVVAEAVGAAEFPKLVRSRYTTSNGPASAVPAPLLVMPYSLETLAALATILATVISVLALVESRAWLVLTSLFFVCLAITAGFYARRERLARASASTVIEGYSIDSLNVANLRRRLDKGFIVQEAHHTARIEGEDLKIAWKYAGYCRSGGASTFEFSIDSGAGVSFDDLDCAAFDLGHDPGMTREIRPLLVGPEGISKKISVPLLEPLKADQSFELLLKCTLPRCITAETGYYSSTLSFAQRSVRRCTVRLEFVGRAPSWMRVYDCSQPGAPQLLKSLTPARRKKDYCEYVDVVEDVPGQSARVYMFWRDPV
jgi:hypothetical protein